MRDTFNRKEFLGMGALASAGLLLPGSPSPAESGPAPGVTRAGAAADSVQLITPDQPEYEALRQGFNRRIQRHPKLIAVCQGPNEIISAVKQARRNNLPVAVRSGGHSFEGYSGNDDGLVINLSQMNAVRWVDATTVKIGPGCTLSKMYDALLPKHRIISAGSCGGVGVAGLTLGGGYGFFSRKYGLTCDNLTEITLVDGSGELRSSRSDAELLWACRGGGNGNFGVVAELVFKTHPAPAFFQSHRFKARRLDAARAAQILERWFELAGALSPSCFSAFVLNGKSLTILITNYEAADAPLTAALAGLRELTDTATSSGLAIPAKALKNYYGLRTPIYFKNSSAGLYKDFAEIRGCIGEVLETVVSTPGLMYQVNTLGGKIADSDAAAASCFPHRDKRFLSEVQAYWETPGHEARMIEGSRKILARFRRHGITAQYANYPSGEFSDWAQAYYGQNYPRLQAVKRKYDPDNRFRHPQSVRPQ